ncbi:MAG: flagellar motor protein MotD [Legionella sp.]|nr:MAG: flagellar motor protein MotD [Legionella sp.]
MKSKKRRRPIEREDNERWIVSYADFITLLFAFFVVMYSISSLNDSKYQSLSEGLHSAFNNKDHGKSVNTTTQVNEGMSETHTLGKFKDGMDDLNKALSDLEDGNYKINHQEGWIELNIKAGSLFKPGNSELNAAAIMKLMALATKLKGQNYPIVIEGYTDNVPIETPQYPSNWELSASRAATVGRVLNGFGVPNRLLMVTGYGEQFPITDNFTPEARSQNRRVVIIIAKNRQVQRILNPALSQIHNTIQGNSKPLQ